MCLRKSTFLSCWIVQICVCSIGCEVFPRSQWVYDRDSKWRGMQYFSFNTNATEETCSNLHSPELALPVGVKLSMDHICKNGKKVRLTLHCKVHKVHFNHADMTPRIKIYMPSNGCQGAFLTVQQWGDKRKSRVQIVLPKAAQGTLFLSPFFF